MKKYWAFWCLFPAQVAFAQPFETFEEAEYFFNNDTFYWPMFILCLGLAGSVLALAFRMAVQHPPPPSNLKALSAAHPEYNRLGGWLVIPMLGLIIKAAGGILSCFGFGLAVFRWNFWILLGEIGKEPGSFINGTSFIGLMILYIWPAFFLPVLLVQFFKRKSVVPAMIIVYTLTSLLITLGNYILFIWAGLDSSGYTTGFFLGQFAVVCIFKIPWLFYFVQSERVKVYFSH